ncbi:MAG: putative phage abortive infection protein [Treponema sp.]|nr:putative phage abortive infection protein [Treponema sp.]
MENKTKKSQFLSMAFSEKAVTIILCGTVLVYLISFLASVYFGSGHFFKYLDEEKMGQFGNFIGGTLGTILVFVSVILYYMALKEQRKDIRINQGTLKLQIQALEQQITEFKAQRKELEQTRNVFEEQTKIYKLQMQTMKTKQFESNFYSYLDIYLKIKGELNEINNKNFASGICRDIQVNTSLKEVNIIGCHDIINDRYRQVHSSLRSNMSRYFKTIFHLIKIIDSSSLSEEEKKAYADTFKSQMEDSELLILYYYCHSFYGNNFQSLILKYNILEHLHPLTKIEFKNKYELTEQMELYNFTEELSKLIDKNICLASSLENTEAIKESKEHLQYGIILSFNIDMEFKFEIQYKHTEDMKFPFQDKFCDFVTHFLYDKFYYSKFLIPTDNNEIEPSIIKRGNNTTFSYTIKEVK